MKLADLAREVHARVGILTLAETTACIRLLNNAVLEAIEQDRDIYIQGFARLKDGHFSPIYKRAHEGKQTAK